MSLSKRNDALEHFRQGNFAKAIKLYLELRVDYPLDTDIHTALARIFYLNRQFEKSLQSYMMTLHLCASAHFQNRPISGEEKSKFLASSSFTTHIGCSQVALDMNNLKSRLSKHFDVEKNLNIYRSILMNKPGKLDDEYLIFCNSIGHHLYERFIEWDNLQLKNTNDVMAMVKFYESLCTEETNFTLS